MTPDARPRFGKGVKLRNDGEGPVLLLVPEAALELNATATAALELVDGDRTLREIFAAVAARFDVDPAQADDELGDLFSRLEERGFVRE